VKSGGGAEAPTTGADPIPFLDVAAANAEAAVEIGEAVARVIARGRFILGREVEAFESEWARYVGAAGCVGVGNGLDALTLALKAMNVGPGDEVIVPGHTFVATWLAVTAVGARPVPVDIDPATYTLDPALIEKAITARTRVVIPVHLYGQPAEMEQLAEVARRYGLLILEDAAQAHGARYGDRRIGSMRNTVAWSFYPGKNLGALGDAGAVTSEDDGLLDRVRSLRNYGSSERYRHDVVGVNSRLDEIQAAALRAKLHHLDTWNARRSAVAAAYLAGLDGSGLQLPRPTPGREHVWHIFAVRHPERDRLRRSLAAAGVETLIHYPTPPHLQSAYVQLGIGPGALPVTELVCREELSLPIGPHIGAEQVAAVIRAIRKAGMGE
jgi:dTDP-4-amino-4,6-dideoxygalactose transaminase